MTDLAQAQGVHQVATLECPWCAAAAYLVDDALGSRIVCPECAVSAPIAPDPMVELPAAA